MGGVQKGILEKEKAANGGFLCRDDSRIVRRLS